MDIVMSKNIMFVMITQPKPMKQTCFNSLTNDPALLWHCSYRHISFNRLKLLQQKCIVNGIPTFKISTNVCENCVMGKHRRDLFPPKSTWRASKILQLIHADIRGPITPTSNSKKMYLINFIDDFSQKTWAYFLVEKHKPFVLSNTSRVLLKRKLVHT